MVSILDITHNALRLSPSCRAYVLAIISVVQLLALLSGFLGVLRSLECRKTSNHCSRKCVQNIFITGKVTIPISYILVDIFTPQNLWAYQYQDIDSQVSYIVIVHVNCDTIFKDMPQSFLFFLLLYQDRISGVMINMLASNQRLYIGICRFSVKHAALRRKSRRSETK
jgi:hypothetical protein